MSNAVTIDTGGPDDVFPGALVTWLHVPRGGYGFTMSLDATVVSYGRRPSTQVRIAVVMRTGERRECTVNVTRLRWREARSTAGRAGKP